MSIGQLAPPELAELLRSLQPGRIAAPKSMGEWQVILRLEQLTPARFDASMRSLMLQSNLDEFLAARVQQRLRGQPLETLTYHSD